MLIAILVISILTLLNVGAASPKLADLVAALIKLAE